MQFGVESADLPSGALMPPRWVSCLQPLGGIAVGTALGWILHLVAVCVAVTAHKEALDLCARFFMLAWSALGWAFGTVLQGKMLHCGGTEKLPEDETEKSYAQRRYVFWGIIAIFLLVLAFGLFCIPDLWYWAFLPTAAFVLGIVGETVAGKPWRFLSPDLPPIELEPLEESETPREEE